jgi:hypothetical protein
MIGSMAIWLGYYRHWTSQVGFFSLLILSSHVIES